MPATLAALAESVRLPPLMLERIADRVLGRDEPLRELADQALEVLGGVIPDWPLLEAWNRWCRENRLSFSLWEPRPAGIDDRERLEVLVHTVMMLASKERGLARYEAAGVAEAEVVMAGDDCPLCERARHRVVALADPSAPARLAPFHPGCRCGILPRLE